MMIATSETNPWVTVPAPEPFSGDDDADLEVTGESTVRWRGFGACFTELGWRALSHLSETERSCWLDRLFLPGGGLGLEFCRLPIGANDYADDWYSLNETPGDYAMECFTIERDRRAIIPYVREALRRNPTITFFASPWSPPTWMKSPPVHNFGRLIKDARVLSAYARYFASYVRAYAAEGIRISQVHVQNEPCSTQKFPSCVMTGADLRDFIAGHLGPVFEQACPETEVWLGTINGPETDAERKYWTGFNDYAFTVMEDPEARRYVRGISYQWAGKSVVWRTKLAYPDLPLIQSENECGDGRNSWEEAWYVADLFHHYIAQGAEAYVYWNPVLEPGGESSWGWRQDSLLTVAPGTGAVTVNPQFHILRHYAEFIRRGDRRLICRRPWAANAVAFEGAHGITIVVRNPLGSPRNLIVDWEGRRFRMELPTNSLVTCRLGV